MPAYKTHISFGVISGLAIGWLIIGYKFVLDKGLFFPLVLVLILGSILPDLDSDEGKPMKITLETFSFLCLGIYYLSWLDSPQDSYVNLIIGLMGTYAIAKYGIGTLVKKFTHHRGIFHSIPALLVSVLLSVIAFKYFEIPDKNIFFLSCTLGIGFLSHLVLDQLANITGKRNLFWGHQHSHPSALKFFSRSKLATFSTYILLIMLIYFAFPTLEKYWEYFK
jgi:membrane-bound metal-dependent hydrolase YbcI (DUF457 family)